MKIHVRGERFENKSCECCQKKSVDVLKCGTVVTFARLDALTHTYSISIIQISVLHRLAATVSFARLTYTRHIPDTYHKSMHRPPGRPTASGPHRMTCSNLRNYHHIPKTPNALNPPLYHACIHAYIPCMLTCMTCK